MRPRSRKEPARARADDRRSRVRSRSKKAAPATGSGVVAGSGQRILQRAVVAHADDLARLHLDDLVELRSPEAPGAETIEAPAAQLEDCVRSEVKCLAGAHAVRRAGTQEERPDDLVAV